MKRPTREEVRVFPTAEAFRAWLEEHHESARELWVGYYRKGVDKPSISYPEAVDHALCFGWIDGIGYRVDDEVHTNRFTPRRKGSYWSSVNIAKVEALTKAGLMTDAGLTAFAERTRSDEAHYSYENRPAELPAEYAERLRAIPGAQQWWETQPPGYRRTATWWVVSAKQQATRDRRMDQLVGDCAAGRPIKLLGYGREAPSGDPGRASRR